MPPTSRSAGAQSAVTPKHQSTGARRKWGPGGRIAAREAQPVVIRPKEWLWKPIFPGHTQDVSTAATQACIDNLAPGQSATAIGNRSGIGQRFAPVGKHMPAPRVGEPILIVEPLESLAKPSGGSMKIRRSPQADMPTGADGPADPVGDEGHQHFGAVLALGAAGPHRCRGVGAGAVKTWESKPATDYERRRAT